MAYSLKFCRNAYTAEFPLGRHGVTTEPRLQTHTVSFWKQAIRDCWIQDGGLFFGIWEEVSEAVDLHTRKRVRKRVQTAFDMHQLNLKVKLCCHRKKFPHYVHDI